MNNSFSVGLYIRLSREDDNKNIESESITNQKSLLMQYVNENNLKVYDIYIDDGYSGTSFDRPSFNRLIKDIENKKVNMVITKDMSRLGRDYIGTGNLIEKYFPKYNVRYVSITDNIDTYLDSTNNDIAPFKAIMNDMYAKDISKKIKSSLRAKMKEGKWVGGRPPFGYKQDPLDKNKLVIDKEKEDVVKRIYSLCLDGYSCYKIAKLLTKEGVKSPSEYYNFDWKNIKCSHGWNSKTIKDILTNEIYTGCMIQNKRSKINYKIKKIVKNNKEDFIVVDNTHERIISKEMFKRVEEMLPKCVGRIEKKENNLLDGLLYCGDCHHRIAVMPRRKSDNNSYTICNYYRTYKTRRCKMHSNNYDKLESAILNELFKICESKIDKDLIKDKVIKDIKKLVKKKDKRKLLKKEINNLNNKIDTIYLDKLNNIITENQYLKIRDYLLKEINNKEKELKIKENIETNINYKKIDDILNNKKFTRELLVNLIKKIEIFEDKSITVFLSFE